jgi:hypothetical protein
MVQLLSMNLVEQVEDVYYDEEQPEERQFVFFISIQSILLYTIPTLHLDHEAMGLEA